MKKILFLIKKQKFSRKILLLAGIILFLLLLLGAIYIYPFFVGKAEVKENITWGIDFSQSQAEWMGVDWKKLYSDILTDLKAKNIKLHTNWSWVGGKQGDYYFDDIDWQIKQAEQKNAKIIYVLGMKTGRWPECHVPDWAKYLSKERQQAELLKYMTEVVLRYKNSKAITYWQVENEPLFRFGECPYWYYDDGSFLKTEINLVKSLDPSREIIISDSGEQSSWMGAAEVGDIVGVTMYRKVWAHITETFGFNAYSFLNPITYAKKAENVKNRFGKKVICIELQAEPWTSVPLLYASEEEQKKSMSPELFKENIKFAKQTGFDTFYLWGVEWWYRNKTIENRPEVWNEAKHLFSN